MKREQQERWRRAPMRSSIVATAAVAGGLVFGAIGFAAGDNFGTQAALPPSQSVAPSSSSSTAPPIPRSGEGTYQRAGGSAPRVGTGKVLRYRVEVERGIDKDPAEFAEWVDKILADPGGWTARGRWSFQRPSAGPVDFVVRLATPDTVDEVCGSYGLDTGGEVSCRGGANVMINLKRWELAIPSYNGDTYTYRHLVVNHEVGHFLGHQHVNCPGKGKPAPVMQTQIYGMNGCVPNGWPYPDLH